MEMCERIENLNNMLNILNTRQQVLKDVKAELEAKRHIIETQMNTEDLVQTVVLLKNPFMKFALRNLNDLSSTLIKETVMIENGKIVEIRDDVDIATKNGNLVMACSDGTVFRVEDNKDENLNNFNKLLKGLYLNALNDDNQIYNILKLEENDKDRSDTIKKLIVCETGIKDVNKFIKKNEKLIKTLSNEKDKLEQFKRTL